MEPAIKIRPIQSTDDEVLSKLIKESLVFFRANKPGTAYFDSSVDRLYSVFLQPGSAYWVVEKDNKVVGGCGIYPTDGLPAGYCELVKFYVGEDARGCGIGTKLYIKCLQFSIDAGYTHIYLETLPELHTGLAFYEKRGFKHLSAAKGNSGHFGCSVWMEKKI